MATVDEILKQWSEVCAAATKGPWYNSHGASVATVEGMVGGWPTKPQVLCNLDDGEYVENPNSQNDGQFVALSRTAFPLAIEALRFAIDAIEMAHTADVPPNVTVVRDAFTRILNGETT